MRAVLRDSELLTGFAEGSRYLRENATESYVESPPAYIITASDGSTFVLGTEYVDQGGRFGMEFNVERNGVQTGEFASKIDYRQNKVRIFGRAGWRVWSGKAFI